MTKETDAKKAGETGKDGVVPHAPPLAPHLVVGDGKAAIDFYIRAFGATIQFRNDAPDGRILHTSLVLPNGGVFMLHDAFPERGGTSRTPADLGGCSIVLNMDLPDVDSVWKRAIDAGAKELMPLKDQFWGDRYGVIVDPSGYRWALATRKRAVTKDEAEKGAKEHFSTEP